MDFSVVEGIGKLRRGCLIGLLLGFVVGILLMKWVSPDTTAGRGVTLMLPSLGGIVIGCICTPRPKRNGGEKSDQTGGEG